MTRGGAAEKYRVVKEHLIHEAALLIMKELPIMEKTQIEFYKNVKAGISFEDMKKMADIVKPVPTTTTSTPVPAPTDSTKTTTK